MLVNKSVTDPAAQNDPGVETVRMKRQEEQRSWRGNENAEIQSKHRLFRIFSRVLLAKPQQRIRA
jgi:hypothetical protein